MSPSLSCAYPVARRVVESIGVSHEVDCCESGCSEEHAFHYVRVRANEHAARREKGAIDLKLDLHPRLRAASPQALMRMTPSQLEVCAPTRIISHSVHC